MAHGGWQATASQLISPKTQVRLAALKSETNAREGTLRSWYKDDNDSQVRETRVLNRNDYVFVINASVRAATDIDAEL